MHSMMQQICSESASRCTAFQKTGSQSISNHTLNKTVGFANAYAHGDCTVPPGKRIMFALNKCMQDHTRRQHACARLLSMLPVRVQRLRAVMPVEVPPK